MRNEKWDPVHLAIMLVAILLILFVFIKYSEKKDPTNVHQLFNKFQQPATKERK